MKQALITSLILLVTANACLGSEWFYESPWRALVSFCECWLWSTDQRPECAWCDFNGDKWIDFQDYAEMTE